MTIADNFNSAPHDVKIQYLLGVLQDIENLFRYVTSDPTTFEKAMSDLKAAYGDENFIDVFLYAVQPELRAQAKKSLWGFRVAYENYMSNTTRGRIAGFFMR